MEKRILFDSLLYVTITYSILIHFFSFWFIIIYYICSGCILEKLLYIKTSWGQHYNDIVLDAANVSLRVACNAQISSCSSSLTRIEVTIHHSACAPILSGRTRVIHHSHGNCLFSGQLCNQQPIRPSACLSLLLSLYANCHSLIRLSQTIPHQRLEEKKEVVSFFFFIHFFFILYSPCPQQGFSGLLLSFLHWREGGKVKAYNMPAQGWIFNL